MPSIPYCPTSYSARYTFSGKERDEETGYSYFGARYYNSIYSIWLSVDPMSDRYPSISPYAYCANNPVNMVDSDGNSPQFVGALVGAGMDMAIQVATNLIQGEKWYKIDVKSVLISAGAGAVGAGLVSKVKQAKHLVELGKAAVTAGFNRGGC